MKLLISFSVLLLFIIFSAAAPDFRFVSTLSVSSISGSPISSPSPAAAAVVGIMNTAAAAAGEEEEPVKNKQHSRMLIITLIAVSSVAILVILSFCFYIWIFQFKNKKKNLGGDVTSTTTTTTTTTGIGGGGGGAGGRLSILGKFSSMSRLISTSTSSSSSMSRSRKGRSVSVSIFEYSLLEAATNNFRDKNILGQGGFGCVYKACFDNNFLAAVKRMDGGLALTEFENEVDLLSKIRHSNIISLLGYCIHGDTRFIIYELMQSGSLETQLHGPSHGSALTWHIRMKIALDAARALEYLHENCNPPVIHRDLKSSNILLDSNFNAKLSDFGLAVISGTQNKNNIKLSGTLGYVAPEYLLDGKLTDKSDVYGFGVILLELLIGRKPVEKMTPTQCQSIVTWAMPQLTDRSKLPNIVDPVIRNTMDLKHLYQVAAVAVLCVQPEPSYRPLITDVLHSLVPLVPVELGGTLRVT